MTYNVITENRIIDDLKKAGIESGDRIVVHSSLKSIGHVEDGANTLIDALIEVVGKTGTIMMPVFTYSFEGSRNAEPYNKAKSVSLTGTITETFRKRPDVLRSSHPTHSMAVWGKDKEEYIRDHDEKSPPFTDNSPLFKLISNSGKILLLGVTHKANSTVHVIEYIAGVPYLKIKNNDFFKNFALLKDDEGNVSKVKLPDIHAGCSKAFDRINGIFGNYQKEVYIGNAKSLIMNAVELRDVLTPVLKIDPGFLLCDGQSGCNCSRKKELILSIKKERD